MTPAALHGGSNQSIAVWQATLGGLNWISDLVDEGEAEFLGGCGYPTEYTARLSALRSRLSAPPDARPVWVSSPGDILAEGWQGSNKVFEEVLEMCEPDEWVHINAWDES